MNKSIEAVIFDIGNVLVTWDPRFLYEKIVTDRHVLEDVLTNVVTLDWHSHHDAGRPFAEGIRQRTEEFPHYADLIAAFRDRWSETLGGPIQGTVTVLEDLAARQVPLFALTNFSAETFPAFRRDYPFVSLFRDVIVSGEEKLVKPDPRIFQLAHKRFGVEPETTLFIDDRLENVQAAKTEGFQGFHFQKPQGLRDFLVSRRIL